MIAYDPMMLCVEKARTPSYHIDHRKIEIHRVRAKKSMITYDTMILCVENARMQSSQLIKKTNEKNSFNNRHKKTSETGCPHIR